MQTISNAHFKRSLPSALFTKDIIYYNLPCQVALGKEIRFSTCLHLGLAIEQALAAAICQSLLTPNKLYDKSNRNSPTPLLEYHNQLQPTTQTTLNVNHTEVHSKALRSSRLGCLLEPSVH